MGTIPTEILNILSDRRSRSEVLRDRRVLEIYSDFPKLRELDTQIRIQTAERMLALLEYRDDSEPARVKERLSRERAEMIAKNAIPEDYDRPIPFCAECGDEGFIDGKECRCLKELLAPLYIRDSGLERYPGISFSEFSNNYYTNPERMKPIYEFCRLYVGMNRAERPNLVFWGNPGTGKTYMAICLVRALAEQAESVLVIRSAEFVETMDEYRTLKRAFNPDPSRDSEISARRQQFLDADCLLIDELGVEARGPHNTADLLHILGERQHNGRTTIITTNLSLTELGKQYDNRLHSRLIGDFRIFHFEGEDIRTRDEYRKSGRGGRIGHQAEFNR